MLENLSLPFLLILGLMLFLFFTTGMTCYKFKFPTVLALILLGMLAGGFLGRLEQVLFYAAEIGIVLLFFLLGLEFPLRRMLEILKKIWRAGLLDVLLNFGGGFLIATAFGLDWTIALFVGGVSYASSSSITIKMLEDKKRLAAEESEFILALLIFEDLIAPIMVSILLSLHGGADISAGSLGDLALKIFGFFSAAIFLSFYVFRKLGDFVGKYLETDIMPLFTVGMSLSLAGLAIYVGLSEVLGAFLAGVMLSETGKASDLEHLTLPLRDLILPFFFFWFGTSISVGGGVPLTGMLLVLVIWSVAGKIIVGVLGGRFYGLSPVRSLRAGLSLVQRGEFSAIIASLAQPEIRLFSGIYILITAFLGIFFFNNAPRWAKKRPQNN